MRQPLASSRRPSSAARRPDRALPASRSEEAAAVPPVFSAGIYTVPAHAAFLDSVATGFIDRARHNGENLADHLILVPDTETSMALRRAFVAALGDGITMMPHIEAVDAMDPATVALQVASNAPRARKLLAMPPAVTPQERQMLLAREIMKTPGLAPTLATAMKLAAELGRFIDDVQRYDADLSRLDALAPQAHLPQWEKTREVLRIVTDTWPAYLKEQGRMDQSRRRRVMLDSLAAHWQVTPPDRPVTAVGFRGSDAATRAVLGAIARHDRGALVLQGFDPSIDDDSWEKMGPGHPDHSVRALLQAAGADRGDVKAWPAALPRTQHARAVNPALTAAAREKLLREVMRPAETAEGWGQLNLDAQALNGMDLVTADTPQEEASVIALKMRETLETPGRTAALVTADRALARRVAARLRHWQVTVEDEAGASLSQAPLGIYLYATAHMAAEEWSPIPFLQALKHPLAALGRDPAVFKQQLAILEDTALHGSRPAPGARGLRSSLRAAFADVASRRRTPDPEMALREKEMKRLVGDIVRAGDEYFKLMARKRPQPFAELLDAHLRYCEALASTADMTGAERMWQGRDGAAAARFFAELRRRAHLMPPMTGRDYTAMIDGMMRDVRVQPGSGTRHPRLRILTPEQALDVSADTLIVGGLTDGAWPPRGGNNPWLTPQMAAALGLPDGRHAAADSAHAFVQALSSPNVLLTRALRSGDAPTVASPFLTRLMMVTRTAGIVSGLVGKSPLRDIHAAIHTPVEVNPVEPPAPTPPTDKRPRQLPVTAVETLMRDPYSVYARYVLRLRPKAPIDAAPGVADRGIATHAALDAFLRRYPDDLPDAPYEELLKIGRETFAAHLDNPTVQSFWWPRFERVAAWFVRFEQDRRETSRTLGTEVRGRLEIDLGDSIFTLTSIADRLDMTDNDQIDIIDYKTGAVPTQKSVNLGFSPQLTLEALIAFTGGFEGIDAGDVGSLQYWKLSGGRPAADVTTVKGDVRALVNQARDGVTTLMRAFSDSKTPYTSTPRPDWAPRYNNYAHLSRVGEWATVKKTGPSKPAVHKSAKRAANQNRAKPRGGRTRR
jgi:ATP-dependent helicase/nuclease subunit B